MPGCGIGPLDPPDVGEAFSGRVGSPLGDGLAVVGDGPRDVDAVPRAEAGDFPLGDKRVPVLVLLCVSFATGLQLGLGAALGVDDGEGLAERVTPEVGRKRLVRDERGEKGERLVIFADTPVEVGLVENGARLLLGVQAREGDGLVKRGEGAGDVAGRLKLHVRDVAVDLDLDVRSDAGDVEDAPVDFGGAVEAVVAVGAEGVVLVLVGEGSRSGREEVGACGYRKVGVGG